MEASRRDGDAFRAEVKISYLGFNLKQRRMITGNHDAVAIDWDAFLHS